MLGETPRVRGELRRREPFEGGLRRRGALIKSKGIRAATPERDQGEGPDNNPDNSGRQLRRKLHVPGEPVDRLDGFETCKGRAVGCTVQILAVHRGRAGLLRAQV